VVCFDERPCQLLAEVRDPLAVGPNRPERRDHEYERGGMANVLMAFEPLAGWRRAEVTERRRGREFAESVRYLAEEAYPEAEHIRLVLDNLSTHTAAAFYETFPPEQARSLARRVEFVYTPVHGSWLNMVSRLSFRCWCASASDVGWRPLRRCAGRSTLGKRSATGWG
jgi:DDE superfamily endonuclease